MSAGKLFYHARSDSPARTNAEKRLPTLHMHARHTNLTIPTHYDEFLMNKSVTDTPTRTFAQNALNVKMMTHSLCDKLPKQREHYTFTQCPENAGHPSLKQRDVSNKNRRIWISVRLERFHSIAPIRPHSESALWRQNNA